MPTEAYIRDRMAQIEAALARRDGNLAVGIIHLIEADGYGDFARDLTKGLVEAGLRNMAAGSTR